MHGLLAHWAGLTAMGALACVSALCSASEAALFSLNGRQCRKLAADRRGRIALSLLEDPDRLLTAVLFWNLIINLAYFAIASMISLRLERSGSSAAAAVVAFGALLVLIVFGEMVPKSVGVLTPGPLAGLLAVPIAGLVRLIGPVLPALRTANLLSRRLFCPRFQAEPHLRIGDLERTVALSTQNAALLEQEQLVLQSIVGLSEIRVDELMRPRNSCRTFRPPVALADLKGQMPPSGYLLVTEPDSDEIAKAIPLKSLSRVPRAPGEPRRSGGLRAVVHDRRRRAGGDVSRPLARGGRDQRVRGDDRHRHGGRCSRHGLQQGVQPCGANPLPPAAPPGRSGPLARGRDDRAEAVAAALQS